MVLIDLTNGKQAEAEITEVTNEDFSAIKKGKKFGFDWDEYLAQEVYKLRLKNSDEILGLICVVDRPEFGHDYLEVLAIETRLEDRGSLKRYDGVAGCLFAFAGRLAFEYEHEGVMSLIPKTKTAALFRKKYGFASIGSVNTLTERLASFGENSNELIRKYL